MVSLLLTRSVRDGRESFLVVSLQRSGKEVPVPVT